MKGWYEQGGAAFPIPYSGMPGQPDAEHGMTLRDWFAGQALAGYFANRDTPHRNCGEDEARYIYEMADAMLAIREKGVRA